VRAVRARRYERHSDRGAIALTPLLPGSGIDARLDPPASSLLLQLWELGLTDLDGLVVTGLVGECPESQ
jgi:hypothetical protein